MKTPRDPRKFPSNRAISALHYHLEIHRRSRGKGAGLLGVQFRRFPMPSITLSRRLLSRKGIKRGPLLVNRPWPESLNTHITCFGSQSGFASHLTLSLYQMDPPWGIVMGMAWGYSAKYSCLGDVHAKGYQVHCFPINHKRYLRQYLKRSIRGAYKRCRKEVLI